MNNRKPPHLALLTAGASALLLSAGAQASLTPSYQFNGNGNWSIDGVGTNDTPVGTISAIVPLGSTIEKAFLYSSLLSDFVVPTVNFDGTVISAGDWTALGATGGLQAFRADVTGQVAATIGGGAAAPFNFQILSENPNGDIDGEVLAIVYSNPGESERTIAFLDGFSAQGGDSTAFNLSSPLTAAQLADPGFEAQLSLGIGYSFRPSNQASTVDVNGLRLTSDAGGQDDGVPNTIGNGGLITVGGIGDDPANPADPFAVNINDPSIDDELYTLVPFLAAGDTQITIDTENPSLDDNIFFAGLNITARGRVNEPPQNGVPDGGSTASLLGLALLGMMRVAAMCRKAKA